MSIQVVYLASFLFQQQTQYVMKENCAVPFLRAISWQNQEWHQVIFYAFDSLYDSFNRHSNRWCHPTTMQGADPWDASPPTPLQAPPTPTGFMKHHSSAPPPVCTHTLHLQPWPRCRRPWTSCTIRPAPPPTGTRALQVRTRPLWASCRRTVPWASCVRLQLRTSSSSCPHRPTSGLRRFPSARGNSTSTHTCEEQSCVDLWKMPGWCRGCSRGNAILALYILF